MSHVMAKDCWRISTDTEVCIGSGICVGIAPDHFQLVDGRSQPIEERVDEDQLVRDAADNCPVEAISVHDSTGRKIAPEL
ncbi:ferredoxin [Streptomyces sp. NPDC102437]|uniref:ferredoxin n=1 Tax=Streptomyces sp. NPDC102437 TaxID=3366175 RepID=UPI0037F5E2A1